MTSLVSHPPNSRTAVLKSRASGDRAGGNCDIIEMYLRELSQLYDVLDPSPFREKDLDADAEEYLVESVKEFPSRAPCELLIHLDQPIGLSDQRVVQDAIRVHFARRSRLLTRDLRRLLLRGLISLCIGVSFLAVVFVIAQVLGQLMGAGGLATLFQEGLLIVGWVAMWRPLEIFLYDWWPIVGERRIHDRLSRISVRIVHKELSPGSASASQMSTQAATTQATRALARWEGEGGRIVPFDG
jgi:hypothetical protein